MNFWPSKATEEGGRWLRTFVINRDEKGKGISARGTFPPEAPKDTDSRQVKRRIERAGLFNAVTEQAFYLPRRVRRAIARSMVNHGQTEA